MIESEAPQIIELEAPQMMDEPQMMEPDAAQMMEFEEPQMIEDPQMIEFPQMIEDPQMIELPWTLAFRGIAVVLSAEFAGAKMIPLDITSSSAMVTVISSSDRDAIRFAAATAFNSPAPPDIKPADGRNVALC